MASRYRPVLEVLKWAPPKTVLRSAVQVSKLWTAASVSRELWAVFLSDFSSTEVSTAAYREFYVTQRMCLVAFRDCVFLVNCEERRVARTVEVEDWLVDEYVVMAFLTHKTVFACGGRLNGRQAKLLDLESAHCTVLPDMKAHLIHHACIHFQEAVYVFGGVSDRGYHHGDMFQLSVSAWRELPKTTEIHQKFTLARINAIIYICGGCTYSCESFDTVTETYSALPFVLKDREWTVTFCHSDTLVIVSHRNMYLYRNAELAVIPFESAYVP